MDHLAILTKRFMDKILTGEKTIESRWSKDRRSPFERANPGDTVYFKYSCGPIAARAIIRRVEYFERHTSAALIAQYVFKNYGALGLESENAAQQFLEANRHKCYVTFITLKQVIRINNFAISKKGYGTQTAWITVGNIDELRTAREESR